MFLNGLHCIFFPKEDGYQFVRYLFFVSSLNFKGAIGWICETVDYESLIEFEYGGINI